MSRCNPKNSIVIPLSLAQSRCLILQNSDLFEAIGEGHSETEFDENSFCKTQVADARSAATKKTSPVSLIGPLIFSQLLLGSGEWV